MAVFVEETVDAAEPRSKSEDMLGRTPVLCSFAADTARRIEQGEH
jgi:hypothetical protein